MNYRKRFYFYERISKLYFWLQKKFIKRTILNKIPSTLMNIVKQTIFKDRISTTIPTTIKDRISTPILTTLENTIISTTIKERISITIPITNIWTTEPKTIQSNISTIIKKLNPTSIIKSSSFKFSSFLSSTINNFLLSSIDLYKENEIIIIQEKSNSWFKIIRIYIPYWKSNYCKILMKKIHSMRNI